MSDWDYDDDDLDYNWDSDVEEEITHKEYRLFCFDALVCIDCFHRKSLLPENYGSRPADTPVSVLKCTRCDQRCAIFEAIAFTGYLEDIHDILVKLFEAQGYRPDDATFLFWSYIRSFNCSEMKDRLSRDPWVVALYAATDPGVMAFSIFSELHGQETFNAGAPEKAQITDRPSTARQKRKKTKKLRIRIARDAHRGPRDFWKQSTERPGNAVREEQKEPSNHRKKSQRSVRHVREERIIPSVYWKKIRPQRWTQKSKTSRNWKTVQAPQYKERNSKQHRRNQKPSAIGEEKARPTLAIQSSCHLHACPEAPGVKGLALAYNKVEKHNLDPGECMWLARAAPCG